MKGRKIYKGNNILNRALALVLASAMTLTMGFNPTIVFAEDEAADSNSVISAINPLAEDVAVQYIEVGGEETDIVFPDSFTATLETTKEVTVEEQVTQDEETPEEVPTEDTTTDTEEATEENTDTPAEISEETDSETADEPTSD